MLDYKMKELKKQIEPGEVEIMEMKEQVYLYIYSFIYVFIYLFIYLYIYVFIYLFIYLFIYARLQDQGAQEADRAERG